MTPRWVFNEVIEDSGAPPPEGFTVPLHRHATTEKQDGPGRDSTPTPGPNQQELTLMATQNSTDRRVGIDHPSPVRRLIAAGIKRTGQPWLVEQPPMSQADLDCHAKASYVRRQPSAA
jgi:hypothetical protein